MTEAATRRATRLAEPVTIRPYRPLDHRACRELWADLIQTKRDLYQDPTIGGPDPGAGFEEYLTRLDLAGIWVAEHRDDGVVGLVGLVLGTRRAGQVEPIVVAERWRGRGIGRALLQHVAAEARRRDLSQVSVSPDSRNIEAIRCLHAAGYDVLSSVALTLDLAPRGHSWEDGLDVHELRFRY
jgi:GNAT superfamily N-acetyltransferase